jgi:hypothetical protein
MGGINREKKGHIPVRDNGNVNRIQLYPFGSGVYIGDLVNATAALRWAQPPRLSIPPIRTSKSCEILESPAIQSKPPSSLL